MKAVTRARMCELVRPIGREVALSEGSSEAEQPQEAAVGSPQVARNLENNKWRQTDSGVSATLPVSIGMCGSEEGISQVGM